MQDYNACCHVAYTHQITHRIPLHPLYPADSFSIIYSLSTHTSLPGIRWYQWLINNSRNVLVPTWHRAFRGKKNWHRRCIYNFFLLVLIFCAQNYCLQGLQISTGLHIPSHPHQLMMSQLQATQARHSPNSFGSWPRWGQQHLTLFDFC